MRELIRIQARIGSMIGSRKIKHSIIAETDIEYLVVTTACECVSVPKSEIGKEDEDWREGFIRVWSLPEHAEAKFAEIWNRPKENV